MKKKGNEVQNDIEWPSFLFLRLFQVAVGLFLGGGETESSTVWENTHAHTQTQNSSLLICFHCLHLRAFVMVTFGSHLICAAPLAPLSCIPLLFSWGFFQASFLPVSLRTYASLFPLSFLALLLSIFSAFPAFTLILSLHFSITVPPSPPRYFSVSFFLCLFSPSFFSSALSMPFTFIYPLDQFQSVSLSSSPSPPLLVVSFSFSFFDPLFHALLSPENLLVFKQHFSV